MKKSLLVALQILTAHTAFAGYMGTTCEAYRISKDSNRNIQTLTIDNESLSIDQKKFELTDGTMRLLYLDSPAEGIFKSNDAKGDLVVKVKAFSEVLRSEGKLSVGRDHEIVVYKAQIQASRNGKTHEFLGTCKTELVTTCGGACEDESEVRDEI